MTTADDKDGCSALHGQFLLCRPGQRLPLGWRSQALQGWLLATHPALPVIDILTGDDRTIGWLCGFPIEPSGRLLGDRWRPGGCSTDALRAADLEAALYRMGGRFAAVILDPGLRRVYLDAGGSLACVYARDAELLGATNTVVEWALGLGDRPSQLGLDTLRSNQFYAAGLTRRPEIARLLPNHFLDLDAWTAHRHWLHEAPARLVTDAGNAASRRIADLVERHVVAVATAGSAYLPLTAGRDSRMLLACSRSVAKRLEFVTFTYDEPDTIVDVSTANVLARRFALASRVVRTQAPSDAQKAQYLQRIGGAGHWGKARDFLFAAGRYLAPDHAFLTGFGGEVGRGFYWGRLRDSSDLPGPERLLQILRLEQSPPALAALRQWLDGIRPHDPQSLLDQLYLEQRFGCWAAPHMYGAAPFTVNLTPFCHREIFDAMLGLPLDYVQAQHLADDVISSKWPELAQVPYQRDLGVAGFARRSLRYSGYLARRIVSKLTAADSH